MAYTKKQMDMAADKSCGADMKRDMKLPKKAKAKEGESTAMQKKAK